MPSPESLNMIGCDVLRAQNAWFPSDTAISVRPRCLEFNWERDGEYTARATGSGRSLNAVSLRPQASPLTTAGSERPHRHRSRAKASTPEPEDRLNCPDPSG